MKRYLRTLLLTFVASLSAVSCVNEMELSEPITDPDVLATFVPRVHSFANEYVTRAVYSENETKITTLSLFVFDEKGKLVSYTEDLGNVSSFQLKKSNLGLDTDLEDCSVYLLANVDPDYLSSHNLADFEQATIKIAQENTVITEADLSNESFMGFPMIGKISANLSPSNFPQPVLEIPLHILYAKVNFEVSVEHGTENEGSGMRFDMTGYTVNNVAKQTVIAEPDENNQTNPYVSPADHAYLGDDETFAVEKTGTATMAAGETAGETISFTFYIAETRFYPKTPAIGVYPSNDWLNTGTHEYDDLKQNFKPKLANTNGGTPFREDVGLGLATYVTLQGIYTDYRSQPWNVNYLIYLGKNNYDNFQVDRNSEYTNHIAIKGIRNNSEGVGEVWIDHRVDAKTDDAAGHVKITRETLIDSHIEVRPLRVQWEEDKFTSARLYLPENEGTLVDWIGVECFTGNNCEDHSTYCFANGKSTGKRRYFTTSLIGELQQSDQVLTDEQGKKYISLSNGHCAWIYFDENTTVNNRPADIKVVFYNDNGPHEEIYAVNQRGLLREGNLYYESYEEYLHTYDSADKYNLSTSPVDYTGKGLQWGFKGVDLSREIIVAALPLNPITIFNKNYYVQDYISQRYDYFHEQDQPSGNSYYSYIEGEAGWVSYGIKGSGISFTDRATAREYVTVEDMGSMPQNAYQYCLSKNKFSSDADDNITMNLHWYLPDAHEMKEIMKGSTAADLNMSANYWTSQPSFDTGIVDLSRIPLIGSFLAQTFKDLHLVDENKDKARAVSKEGGITNVDREIQNRIRCLYSDTGITVNLSDRIPDGVNGNYSFVMKGDNVNQYFNYVKASKEGVKDYVETSDGSTEYKYTTFNYPTVEESYGKDKKFSDKCFKDEEAGHKGFLVNPTDKQYWGGETYYHITDIQNYTYYTLLAEYPGLSNKELKNDYIGNSKVYRELDSNKEDTKLDSTSTTFGFSQDIKDIELKSLDHTVGGDMFAVTIDKSSKNSYSPEYVYQRIVDKQKNVYSRLWDIEYKETSYVKTINTKEMDFDGEGIGEETKTGLTRKSAENAAKEAAVKEAKANALTDAANKVKEDKNYVTFVPENHPKNLIIYDEIYSEIVGKQGGFPGYRCTWTAKYKCTIKMPAKESSETVTYFAEPEGDPWREKVDIVNIFNEVQLDELRIYLGNSFTISLSDNYKDDYEIVKVKLHLSKHKKIELSGNNNNVIPRFVDDQTLKQLPISSTTEISLDAYGMTFRENTTASTGIHQWSTNGEGRSAVTMNLVEYYIAQNVGSDSYEYREVENSRMEYYVVVDRIDVKVKLKTTAQTE